MRAIKSSVRKLTDAVFNSYFGGGVRLHRDSALQLGGAAANGKGAQILLSLKYRELSRSGGALPAFEDVGFRAYSQNDEDGILLYIFSLIGTLNRQAVEVCAGDGIECNTANLIINHGWSGLLFDGDAANVARGREFYARCPDTWVWPPQLIHEWVDAENINSLISGHGVRGEIDLLSVDLDGVDYWVWEAIDCIDPRVVVVEYQNVWGPGRAVTVPYRKDFDRFAVHPDYFGASLAAFVKLGRRKGYRLVGCNRYGFNAFFIRSGVGEDLFAEVPAESCFHHPQAKHAMGVRLREVAGFEWVEV